MPPSSSTSLSPIAPHSISSPASSPTPVSSYIQKPSNHPQTQPLPSFFPSDTSPMDASNHPAFSPTTSLLFTQDTPNQFMPLLNHSNVSVANTASFSMLQPPSLSQNKPSHRQYTTGCPEIPNSDPRHAEAMLQPSEIDDDDKHLSTGTPSNIGPATPFPAKDASLGAQTDPVDDVSVAYILVTYQRLKHNVISVGHFVHSSCQYLPGGMGYPPAAPCGSNVIALRSDLVR